MRKGWKRGHRLVVLPDYQGIGIGMAFHNATSQIIFERGFHVNSTTTTPALFHAMNRDDHWALFRYGRAKNTLQESYARLYGKSTGTDQSASSARITYSFNYLGSKDGERKRIRVEKKKPKKRRTKRK